METIGWVEVGLLGCLGFQALRFRFMGLGV